MPPSGTVMQGVGQTAGRSVRWNTSLHAEGRRRCVFRRPSPQWPARLRGMAKSAVLIAAAVLGMAQARDARACSCAPQNPVEEEVALSAVVFAGSVVAVASDRAAEDGSIVALFGIDTLWKGPERQWAIAIRTAANSAACGLHFEKGQKWLIYARAGEDSKYTANLCSRSNLLVNAQEDLAELGEGKRPPAFGCGFVTGQEGGRPWGALGLLGVAAALAGRRRLSIVAA